MSSIGFLGLGFWVFQIAVFVYVLVLLGRLTRAVERIADELELRGEDV